MSIPRARFFECLSSAGLLSAAEISQLENRSASDPALSDVGELARELVRQGKLTTYQATVINDGNSKSLVLGNYLILDELGAGGMGHVFRARHRKMDRVVALKVLPDKSLSSPEAIQRFQREVKATARLVHPHIVTAHDAAEEGGMHYLVMEYVEGSDLSKLVRQRGPLPVAKAVNYILQAARGLEHAHAEGVIHRDIKPSNLLVDKRGVVKILDMGLARFNDTSDLAEATHSGNLTQTGNIMGTIDYMAPEQAMDTHYADERSDIYSLGCTLHFLLAGRPPFEADTVMKRLMAHRDAMPPSLREARPFVPESLDMLFQRMLAKNPADRPQTATEVITSLEMCAASISNNSFSSEKVATGRKRPNRRGILAAIGIAIVAALVVRTALSTGNHKARQPLASNATATATTPPQLAVSTHAESRPSSKAATGAAQSAPEGAAVTDPAVERRAAEWALGLGGKVSVIVGEAKPLEVRRLDELPTAPFTIEAIELKNNHRVTNDSLIVLDGLSHVKSLSLVDTAISDGFVEHVRGFTSLTTLLVHATSVGDAGIDRLADLPRLSAVFANGTLITDRGAQSLSRNKNVSIVHLINTQVSDDGLAYLAQLPLHDLAMNDTRVTDAGLKHLESSGNLSHLVLDRTGVTDAGLRSLSSLSNLRFLHLRENKITDRGVESLVMMKSLTELALRGTEVSQAGYEKLRAALPTCKIDGTSAP